VNNGLLAGVHQMGGLMEHMVNTSEEVLPKGNAVSSSQVFSHCNMVQSWLIGVAAKDKSAKPHVQKSSVFNLRQGAITHMVLDILFISRSCFHSSLPARAFVLVRVHRSCNIKAGHHVNIGQSGRHWSMTKEESVDAV
jgi:hypothetical protein